MKTIAESTPTIPELVAERVAPDQPEVAAQLCARAERHYARGGPFARKIRGAHGLERLEMFMDHWMQGMQKHPRPLDTRPNLTDR